MCQRTRVSINASEVHGYARSWMGACLGLKDHGPKCTAERIIFLLLKAAARMYSIYAACRDLADAPSDQAVRNALHATLPEIEELQKRINKTLTTGLPKRVYRYPRVVAIDVTLLPYYGQPESDPSEIYRSKQKKGTTKFHGYATACIVQDGMRYTVALTRITRGEKSPEIARRLVQQVRKAGLKIKRLLLDRGFFTVDTITYLKRARVPFLMPVAIRAPKPKDPKKLADSLRGFLKKSSGWYDYRFKGKRRERIRICVCAKYYKDKKTGKRKMKRLLFAAWGYEEHPDTTREQYRKRFGIETSYRQGNQARIRTSERCPKQRLLYFAIALILRNVWVWIHFTIIADRRGEHPDLRLERLRFRRMLEWIEEVVKQEMHDGTLPMTEWQPGD
jgi:Transposase DDE domain